MDKWEYTMLYAFFRGPYSLEKKMDELGKQGWELTCAVGAVLYFKRRLPS